MEEIKASLEVVKLVSNGIVYVTKELNSAQKQSELKKKLDLLKEITEHIEGIQRDADNQEGTSNQVAALLKQLQQVNDDVKNIWTLVGVENDRIKHIKIFGSFRDNLSFLSHRRRSFHEDVLARIQAIEEKLSHLKGRLVVGTVDAGKKMDSDVQGTTTATLGNFTVRGREEEVEKIVQILTGEEGAASCLNILPICGMGGIGKTTLAREVLHHRRVKEHFKPSMWVHVARTYNPIKLTRMILESAVYETASAGTSSSHSTNSFGNSENRDILEKEIRKRLNGRRFLLILDDVWTSDVERLNPMALAVGARGSWILVTARSEAVAQNIGTVPSHTLPLLSREHCRSIIIEHARNSRRGGRDLHQDELLEQIAEKCHGLPVAATAYGISLRGVNEDQLEGVPHWKLLNNEQIDENYQILLRLMVSYRNLKPPHLKKCFQYCAIFPDGHSFDREKMALYWMAADIIKDPGEYPEAEGLKCFDSLVQASLLQRSARDSSSDLVMHEFFREISRDLSGTDRCFAIEHGKTDRLENPENARLASFVYYNEEPTLLQKNSNEAPSSKKPLSCSLMAFADCVNLNVLILLGDRNSLKEIVQLPHKVVQNLTFLHTLDLSNTGIETLDNATVSGLKCLRFLGLSHTRIRSLPKSLNKLHQLQTLLLRNCLKLEKLPPKLGCLQKLRHLDLGHDDDFQHAENRSSNIMRSMPEDIGELTQLRTLSRFVVGSKDACSGLNKLTNLRGDLSISNLQVVSDPEKVKDAGLEGKKHLKRLKLEWKERSKSSKKTVVTNENKPMDRQLENLKPYREIKELWIEGYLGICLPSWIVGDQYLTTIRKFTLYNCRNCKQIPSLVHLPSLENLKLGGMDAIRYWNCIEFCGTDKSASRPSLLTLEIEDMPEWERWSRTDGCRSITSLRELVIKNCPKLVMLTHGFAKIESMVIKDCPNPILLADGYECLQNLIIKNCPALKSAGNELQWSSFRKLQSLRLTGLACRNMLHIKLDDCNSITDLKIGNLPDAETISDEWLPPHLKCLTIKQCPLLLEVPRRLCHLSFLEELIIEDCGRLRTLPESLRSLGELKSLSLSDCSNIFYQPTHGLPPKLRILDVKNCAFLENSLKDREEGIWAAIKTVQDLHINGEYYQHGELYSSKINQPPCQR